MELREVRHQPGRRRHPVQSAHDPRRPGGHRRHREGPALSIATAQRPPSLDATLCHALYAATNATLQLYRDLLAPWGLTYQQFLVLAHLYEQDGATPGAIGDALLIDSSSVAGLLRRLQRDGLVERSVDEADRRRVRVTATPRALGILTELGFLQDCIGRAVQLDDSDVRDLIARLQTLRASLTEFPRPASQP